MMVKKLLFAVKICERHGCVDTQKLKTMDQIC